MPNLGPDLGPVRLGSGPDGGSEPDCGNPNLVVPLTIFPVNPSAYNHPLGTMVLIFVRP